MSSEKVLSTYRVIWQRVGENERFRHFVVAENAEQARRRSNIDILSALGPNFDVWEVVDVSPAPLGDAAQAAVQLS